MVIDYFQNCVNLVFFFFGFFLVKWVLFLRARPHKQMLDMGRIFAVYK